jgi:hypothetical protein
MVGEIKSNAVTIGKNIDNANLQELISRISRTANVASKY